MIKVTNKSLCIKYKDGTYSLFSQSVATDDWTERTGTSHLFNIEIECILQLISECNEEKS